MDTKKKKTTEGQKKRIKKSKDFVAKYGRPKCNFSGYKGRPDMSNYSRDIKYYTKNGQKKLTNKIKSKAMCDAWRVRTFSFS